MIYKSELLSRYVAAYETSGLNLGVFPTNDGTRYAIRCYDPEDLTEDGRPQSIQFEAAFAKSVEQANRPKTPAAAAAQAKALNDLLHSKNGGGLVMCYCVVDQESIDNFGFAPEDLGREYKLVAKPKTVVADFVVSDLDASNKTVVAD